MKKSRPFARLFLAAATLGAMLATATPASTGAQQAELVRIFRTSQFGKPSPDPSGLALLSQRGAVVIVDSEVEEGPHFAGTNVWIWKPGEGVLRNLRTTRFSMEPTDVALNGSGNTMYITDDSEDGVFIWRKGGDARWGTEDDPVSMIQTRHFASRDTAGADFARRSLFLTDGDNATSDHRVYRLRPGPNGQIDGAAPQGDDVVTSFSTLPLGITLPSDVVYDADSGHLFIVSAQEEVIAEATLAGDFVTTYDMSHTTIRSAAGVTFAPASGAGTGRHLFVADRGKDNEEAPAENDGRIFEFDV